MPLHLIASTRPSVTAPEISLASATRITSFDDSSSAIAFIREAKRYLTRGWILTVEREDIEFTGGVRYGIYLVWGSRTRRKAPQTLLFSLSVFVSGFVAGCYHTSR